jgi:hypothetical protein
MCATFFWENYRFVRGLPLRVELKPITLALNLAINNPAGRAIHLPFFRLKAATIPPINV